MNHVSHVFKMSYEDGINFLSLCFDITRWYIAIHLK